MKTIITLLIAFASHLLCFGQTTDQQIIAKINASTSALKTMQCDFVQTKQVKLLNDKMVSKGKMYYQQSSKLRWEYTTPYAYTFLLNDNKITLAKNNRKDVIDVNQNKMFKEIVNIMMSSVVGKCLSDSKSFKTTVKDNGNEWIATLIPQKKEMKQMFSKFLLHFNKQQGVVVQVEMFEKKGDKTSIELKNIKKNKQIDAKIFSVN